jgi:hypothetical protein
MTDEKPSGDGPATQNERLVADVEAQLDKGRDELRKSKEQIARSKDLRDKPKHPAKPD